MKSELTGLVYQNEEEGGTCLSIFLSWLIADDGYFFSPKQRESTLILFLCIGAACFAVGKMPCPFSWCRIEGLEWSKERCFRTVCLFLIYKFLVQCKWLVDETFLYRVDRPCLILALFLLPFLPFTPSFNWDFLVVLGHSSLTQLFIMFYKRDAMVYVWDCSGSVKVLSSFLEIMVEWNDSDSEEET